MKKTYVSEKIMSRLAGEKQYGLWLYPGEEKKRKVLLIQLELLRIAGIVKRRTANDIYYYWMSGEYGV